MKYRVIKEFIYEDKRIWDTGETLGQIARRTGIPKSYLSILKNGKRIPTEDTYKKVRDQILGDSEQHWDKEKLRNN